MKKYKNTFWLSIVIVLSLQLMKPLQVKSINPEIRFDIFSQENGLPNNQIQSIYQDKKGWMWIGTSQGLSRFDGYKFVNFLPNTNDSNSIAGNLVRVIKEDSRGNLYIGTETGGLNVYNRDKECFSQPYKNHPDFKYKEVSVNCIEEDRNGNLWIGTDFNIMVIDTTGNIRSLKPNLLNSENSFIGNYIRNLKFDNSGNLWIGTNNGLFIYDPLSNKMELFPLPFSENQNIEIWEIYLDDEGLMWIGTYSAGLFIIDTETKLIQEIELESKMARTETVRSISKGIFGEFWIGTRGGLFKYSKSRGVTGFHKHNQQAPKSLSNNSILSIFLDSKGETWIGTRGGLNLLAKRKQVFHNFSALPGDNNYLNSGTIYSFWINENNKIWIGTEDGGINIYDPATKTYEYLMADEQQKNTISQNCIKSFLKDNKGNLWIGTFLGGIDLIDLRTKQIKHFKHDPEQSGSLSDNRVWDICMDNNGGIWTATSKGVDKYIPETNSFMHYPQLNGKEQISWLEPDSNGNLWMGSADEVIVYNIAKNSTSRYFEHSRSMFENSNNEIWIATTDKGIAIYSATAGAINYYNESDGLANNQALCILEDEEFNLWISTTNGLSKFNTTEEYFQNFSSNDGLSNNQFCYGAAYKTKSGELLFGSITGFNMFNPNEIITDNNEVPIVLTDLKIFNKSILISDDKKAVLTKSISETDHLTLNYDQNVFTIEFSALNYINSENNLYSYMLEGFNREWNEPGKERTATYTNLNPGDYTLRIKRVIPGNLKESNEHCLKITVLPPYWKTYWFLALIFSTILFLIYILVKFFINREKIKNQLVLERVNARKLHELDMLKLKFFTNISHEIRTPLTLILGPLEKIIGKNNSDNETQEHLHLMHRNAKNLDKLISQLLDFRKLQTGNLKLNLTEADIVSFVRNIVNSFNHFAIEKQIKLKFTTLKKELNAAFDPDKVEKILNNLLSNAFKFTNSLGSISITLSLVFDTDDDDFIEEEKEKQFIEITIKDTGKGISGKNLNKIFTRFFQSDDEEESNSGAGIGLALVKELVNLHKGRIFVTSKPGKGTKFTLRIPYNIFSESKQAEIPEHLENKNQNLISNSLVTEESNEKLSSKIMLIVEDNADVRQFIAGHFNTQYKIHEAKNGAEGWELALNTIPDIIISDIIMPNMDGFEFCKKVKNDERTSHIPILFLTALHSKEHELKGLTTGADDFITKPFDLSVLQAKIENILSIRESLKEKYTSTVVLEPTNVILTSPDERFLRKAIDVIELNISDSELDIESFSKKVGVSRMQLYRKLHALTNMTVKEFIRHIRLKRATQLLVQQKMNISEVAYEVGFKDLSHFRKCFKREFGMSATDYISNRREQTPL